MSDLAAVHLGIFVISLWCALSFIYLTTVLSRIIRRLNQIDRGGSRPGGAGRREPR